MSKLNFIIDTIKSVKENKQDESPKPVIQQEISPLNFIIETIKQKQDDKKDIDTSVSNDTYIEKGDIRLHKPENGSLKDINEVSDNELYSHGFVEDKTVASKFLQPFKEVLTAPIYGNYAATSSFYNTLANIPGGLSSLSKFVADKYGKKLEVSESGMIKALDYAEDYLRHLSIKYNPSPDNPYYSTEATFGYRPEAPETFTGKVMSAIGQAPITVGEYLPAMKVAGTVGKFTKGLTVVQKTPSVVKGLVSPAAVGFAATDALREIDKGGEAATIAGLKGFLLGRTMNAFEPFNFRTRVTAMGTLGFGATDGNFEDKMVGGITFATLSAIGKIEGKSIKDAKSDLSSYLSGQNVKQKQLIQAKETEAKTVVDNIIKIGDDLEVINREIREAKKAKEENTKRINDKQLETLEKKAARMEKDIFTLRDNYAHSIADLRISKEYLDVRSVDAVIESMFKPSEIVKNPKTNRNEYVYKKTEKDIAEKFSGDSPTLIKAFTNKIGKIATEFLYQTAPPTFFSKSTNSLFKKGHDEVKINRIERETALDTLFKNPEFQTATSYFKNIIEGLKPKSGKDISVLPASMYAKTGVHPQSPEGILTANSKSIPKIFEVGPLLEKFATKNKNKRSLFNKKTNDLTPKALKEEFKLNDAEIAVYFSIRKIFRDSLKTYNEFGKKYLGAEFSPVKELPSYFAHMFTGEHRIFINRKSDGKLMAVVPSTNIVGAYSIKKKVDKNLPEYTANVKQRKVKGDLSMSLFAEMHNLLKSDQTLLNQIKPFIDEAFTKHGMSSHRMPRKQSFVEGYAGGSLELYKKLGIPEQKARIMNAEQGVQSVLMYSQGAINAAYQMKLMYTFKKILNNSTVSKFYPNTQKLLARYYDSLFSGDFTSLRKGDIGAGQAADKYLSNLTGISPQSMNQILGTVNGYTYFTKLLAFNFRFLGSQILQPYQMIIPQLYRLQAVGQGANPMAAFFKSQFDLIKPSKEIKELIQYNIKNKSISAAFHEDFVSALKGGFGTPKYKSFFNALSGRNLASRLEQFSRLNTSIMIYRTLRENGDTHQAAMRKTPHLVDTYMVEYNMTQKAPLYGSSGLMGRTLGKPYGVFKTFMHNYLAQAVEHVRTTQKTGDIMPTAVFATNMILSAGLFGAIGIGTTDLFLTQLDKSVGSLFRKAGIYGPSERIPTLSEILYNNNLHPALLFGVVSTALDTDLSATLSAPANFGFDSVIELPPGLTVALDSTRYGLEYAVKLAKSGFDRDKVLIEEYNFLKAISPNIMQGYWELYYNSKLNGDDFFMFEEQFPFFSIAKDYRSQIPRKGEEDPKTLGPVIIAGQGTISARLRRDMDDWKARFFSAYSIRESYFIKTQFHLMKLAERNAITEKDMVDIAVITYMRTGTVPESVFAYFNSIGVSNESLWKKRMIPRIKSLSTDVLERNIRGQYTDKKQNYVDTFLNDFIGDYDN